MARKYNGGAWTEGRFKSFVTSVLRAGSRKWPPKYGVLNKAKTEKKVNPATGRVAQMYRCKKCKQEFSQSNVQVDHIKPIASIDGFTTWDEFIDRLFCEEKNMQVLCKPCHKAKTAKEKKK